MQQLIINPEFGLAGDMLSAAFISAGVPAAEITGIMTAAAARLGGADVGVQEKTRGSARGVLLTIQLISPPHSTAADIIMDELRQICSKWTIKPQYQAFAVRALSILIEAEKQAHRKLDQAAGKVTHHYCHLHEAQDILIDIAGAAYAAQLLEIDMDNVLCLCPVFTGSGKINFSHGSLDVPAPAVAAIIDEYKFPVRAGEIKTELLTPTGAALLAAFKPRFIERESFRVDTGNPDWKTGTGFGTKDFVTQLNKPNAVFVYLRPGESDEQ